MCGSEHELTTADHQINFTEASSLPANSGIPIYIASMSPGMLELTGTVADG
ncbi:MAG TPA: hypothetical protein VGH77_01125 [Streptosporangiaceae bacterium]